EVLPRRALHDRRDQVPAVARVGKLRPRRGEQQVSLEDGEPLEHRVEVAVPQELVTPVVPDAREVPGELAGSDRIALVWQRGDVALNRRVEIELPLLVEERHGRRGQGLRDAADAELS